MRVLEDKRGGQKDIYQFPNALRSNRKKEYNSMLQFIYLGIPVSSR